MMINDENKRSLKKMLGGKALYLALGICVLAAGFVGYSAMKTADPSEIKITPTSEAHTYVNIKTKTEREETTKDSASEKIQINAEPSTSNKEPETDPPTQAVFDNDVTAIDKENKPEKSVFKTPLSSGISSDYSMGVPVFSQTMSDYRTHNGVDFKGVRGENVSAIGEGTVTKVSQDDVWGYSVEIDHGNGIKSTTSGLAAEGIVSEGTYVYTGTVIGVVGTVPVESKESDHVHLEMRVNGTLADPLEILGINE